MLYSQLVLLAGATVAVTIAVWVVLIVLYYARRLLRPALLQQVLGMQHILAHSRMLYS